MTANNQRFAKFIGLPLAAIFAIGALTGGHGNQSAATPAKAETVAQEERQPHYITPTGPTKVVQYGTVGCITFEDFLDVVSNEYGMKVDVEALKKARRCFDLPIGLSVAVVERGRTPPAAGGKETNWVCVKPADLRGDGCVWVLIQRLDVRAD